jgi:predicted metal-dependent HD superfamily phosphohydrolase
MNLKERFIQNCLQFSNDQYIIDDLWTEIETKYSQKSRYYHNLEHLESMFSELESVKNKIQNFTEVSFSVFYHDIIYDATSKLNEEKSAEFSEIRLKKLNVNSESIEKISQQILATKSHLKSDVNDINYLLDADLVILGKDLETYIDYTEKIRKEYAIYPDLLYKPGRRKVLKHFLELENIFKTEDFREKYEVRARENILFEIERL